MSSFFRTNALISSEQHGFLSRRSTVTQLLETYHDWCASVNDRKFLDVLFVDFQKAFDSCSHVKLLEKLSKYGIQDHLLCWIKNFLSYRTQVVQVGEARSRVSHVLSGVPQGSVLGPLLFLIYINDLACVMPEKVVCKLYADDLKVYTSFAHSTVDYSLDRALLILTEWSNMWQLPIAISKCSVLHIGHSNPRQFYALDTNLLNSVDVICNHGVLMSTNLSFAAQCAAVSLKSS
jgi:hypothetical protein